MRFVAILLFVNLLAAGPIHAEHVHSLEGVIEVDQVVQNLRDFCVYELETSGSDEEKLIASFKDFCEGGSEKDERLAGLCAKDAEIPSIENAYKAACGGYTNNNNTHCLGIIMDAEAGKLTSVVKALACGLVNDTSQLLCVMNKSGVSTIDVSKTPVVMNELQITSCAKDNKQSDFANSLSPAQQWTNCRAKIDKYSVDNIVDIFAEQCENEDFRKKYSRYCTKPTEFNMVSAICDGVTQKYASQCLAKLTNESTKKLDNPRAATACARIDTEEKVACVERVQDESIASGYNTAEWIFVSGCWYEESRR